MNEHAQIQATTVVGRRASEVLFNLITAAPRPGCFLLPANICPIVPVALRKARRAYEFVDISPRSLCMDEEQLLTRWHADPERYAGVVQVRTYGVMHEMQEPFRQIKALSPDALLVDDRCLCPPEPTGGVPDHTDAVLFSTGYAKYVDLGVGGFAHLAPGVPYRATEFPFDAGALDGVMAACKRACSQREPFEYEDVPWLDTGTLPWDLREYEGRILAETLRMQTRKAAVNAVYAERLPPDVQLPARFQQWRFNLLVRNPAGVLDAIRSAGLFASQHFDSLAGVFGPGDAPVARFLHAHVVNLFNDRYFTVEQAERLVNTLLAHPELLRPVPGAEHGLGADDQPSSFERIRFP